jgi:tRNA nucleotidyltransferase (CCA-adding enzyme)
MTKKIREQIFEPRNQAAPMRRKLNKISSAKKINLILKEVLERVEPPKEELETIERYLKEFLKKFEKRLRVLKINAEIFVGGSFAKNTLIRKGKYDIDLFLRFDKKYKDRDISALTKKTFKRIEFQIIHGSRDYFRIKMNSYFFIELIPVIKVRNPKEAENITDLSYSHVNYIKKRLKSKKILDEIRIAKAFCYANHCYGAESYINGFSGYSLELLIYYYGSFIKFIKAVSKIEKKVVIDIEKKHKNKQSILMDLNSSKLNSPIILIDPTYKQRNALAALSKETFEKFKKDCKKFLKNPSIKSFEIKKTDLEKIKEDARKKKLEFVLIEAKTSKQTGDIAGSKLLKFYRHLNYEIEKFFEIKNKEFDYDEGKSAKYFFVVKNKKEILIQGPSIKDLKNIKKFKRKHRTSFVKSGRIYAQESAPKNLKKFIENWKKKSKGRIGDMSISKLGVVD